MKNKLTIFEAISIISIITISQIILNFPELLIHVTGTGTIVNLVFLSIFVLIFCIIISNIFKHFANQDIIDISELLGGKILKFIVSLIFIFFLLITAIHASSNFIYLLKNIYFKGTSFLFIFSIFLISILIACYKGFYSTKRISTFFFGIFVLSIFCLTLGDNGNFNTNNLIPIFGYNYKTTFQTGISNIFIFNFVLIYFFLMPLLTKKNDYKKIIFSSFAINFLLIVLSVIAVLQYYPTSISSELSNINSSNIILALTRRIQISSFLSQTDSLFILFWGYAILCYVSILIDGIIYILNKNFIYEKKEVLSFSIIPILLAGVIIFSKSSNLYYLESTIFKDYSIILTFIISTILLLLGYFKKMKH